MARIKQKGNKRVAKYPPLWGRRNLGLVSGGIAGNYEEESGMQRNERYRFLKLLNY